MRPKGAITEVEIAESAWTPWINALHVVGLGTEPILHTGDADVLAEIHPLAHESVFCARCDEMVHAFNNECMQDWVELPGNAEELRSAMCLECYARQVLEWDRDSRP